MVDLTRRDLLALGGAGAVALGLAGAGRLTRAGVATWTTDSSTVGLSPFGTPVLVPHRGGPALVPGTRVVADTSAGIAAVSATVEAESRWLAAASLPGGEEFVGLARNALLDLHVLLRPVGALASSWLPGRRFVDPVDAALGAAALAACGQLDDALDVVTFLARVQSADGRLERRYPLAPAGPSPAGRGEVEPTGWALWAADAVIERSARDLRRQRLGLLRLRLRPMLSRSVPAILNNRGADGLPLPPVGGGRSGSAPSLALAASQVLGLHAAVALGQRFGNPRVEVYGVADVAVRMDERIARAFGPTYASPRGRRGAPDPAVAFLLPPMAAREDAVRRAAAVRVASEVDRVVRGLPAGRIAVRTHEIALAALGGTHGGGADGRRRSRRALRWLDGLRTAHGSLPEIVLLGARPGGPITGGAAPTARVAALTLLALRALGDSGHDLGDPGAEFGGEDPGGEG